VDPRAEQLFGAEASKRILKVLHFFSHANNIECFVGNNELIFDLEHAVNDLLTEIENKDSLHCKALMSYRDFILQPVSDRCCARQAEIGRWQS